MDFIGISAKILFEICQNPGVQNEKKYSKMVRNGWFLNERKELYETLCIRNSHTSWDC